MLQRVSMASSSAIAQTSQSEIEIAVDENPASQPNAISPGSKGLPSPLSLPGDEDAALYSMRSEGDLYEMSEPAYPTQRSISNERHAAPARGGLRTPASGGVRNSRFIRGSRAQFQRGGSGNSPHIGSEEQRRSGFFTPGSSSPVMRPSSPKPPPTGQFFVPGVNTPNERNMVRRRSWSGGAPPPRSAARDLSQLRLLRRDAPFHQSSGKIYMHRTGAAMRLALHDSFHVALSMPAILLFTTCITGYTLLMLAWAGLYVALDHPGVYCGIGPLGQYPSFYHAFAFSMETMTTIGYGIPQGEPPRRGACMRACILRGVVLHASIVHTERSGSMPRVACWDTLLASTFAPQPASVPSPPASVPLQPTLTILATLTTPPLTLTLP